MGAVTERSLAANRCLDVIEVESRAALIGHERPLSQTVGLFWVRVCVVLFPSHVPLVCQPMRDKDVLEVWPADVIQRMANPLPHETQFGLLYCKRFTAV